MTESRELVWLLEDLCVKQGFCLSPCAQGQLLAAPPSTPKLFAAAVVRAAGLDPELNEKAYLAVLEVVERAFQRSAT